MKVSIRTRLIMLLFGCIAGLMLITLLMNTLLLKPYYKSMKEQSLNDSYNMVAALDFDADDIYTQLESLEETRNIQILMIDNNYRVFFCSSSVVDSLFLPVSEDGDTQSGKQWFDQWLMPDDYGDGVEIFSTQPGYGTRYNSELSASYLSLYAKALLKRNGFVRPFYIIINTPIAAIEDGVKAANKLALIIGLVGLVAGGMVTFVIGSKVVEPVVKASEAAKKMAHLDFSVRLEEGDDDELGQLSESINQLSSQLEAKIDELSIANRRLKKELAQKEKIDNMRRQFISDVSHELKTPLSIIMGYCEGLQLDVSHEDMEYYCTVIQDEAIRMNKLAVRLLGLAELESGDVEPEMSAFDLGELASDRLSKLQVLLDERGVRSSVTVTTDKPVWGDRERIEEVVNNLLTNAKNYTPDGGEIRVSVSEEEGGEGVICRVYNSGSHIPEESLERIWDSFYKVDKARTRSYGGSGLGLKIVSTILQAHKAKFGAENTEDGVMFYFTLAAPEDTSNAK